MRKISILNLNVSGISYSAIIALVKDCVKEKKHFSFLNVNAYIAILAKKDKELLCYLNNFSTLFTDGIGIYLASKVLYGSYGIRQRINGTDLYVKLLELAEKNSFRIYFFGGSEKAISILREKIKNDFPNLIVAGLLGRDSLNDIDLMEKLNISNSDILFVGLGTPYQEKWIAENGKNCNIPVQIAVGSGIEFLAGTEKRAPKIMRNLGLEWLYRIYQNPKRLWKRYLFGIPKFIYLIILQTIKNKIK